MSDTRLQHLWQPAVNFSERRSGLKPEILLLHYTAMDCAKSACDWLCCAQSQVSCHYLIDETGGIIQMVAEDHRAWHAGKAHWAGIDDVNSASIGIEIHNDGQSPFPAVQMQAVCALSRDITDRHGISPRRVLGHCDVAPGRKIDPGDQFDWAMLHEHGLGHWVEPAAIEAGTFFQLGDSGEPVAALKALLACYGYGIDISEEFDEQTRDVVTAFQLHFRQQRCDGIADQSTIKTLHRLLSG